VSSMSRESSKDTLDTIKEIHKLLDSIELKQVFRESMRLRAREREKGRERERCFHIIMIKNCFTLS